jgi:hypothetical protein
MEKELNDLQRIPLDIEILSNLRFGSLEIRDTSVTRVTNNYFVCSRPLGSNAAAPPLPSSRRVLPHRLPDRVDQIVQNLDEYHVRCSSSASASWHVHTALRRRPVDHLLLLESIKDSTNNTGHASRRGHSPCATQGSFQYSDTVTDPDRPFGLHHLHSWQRSLVGSREEVLCVVSSSVCVDFRGSQESSPCRLRPPSSVHDHSHFLLSGSAGNFSM